MSGGRDPASEYYNNLCMKAVNQCIGRAIRHQNDYSAMLLLDNRYQAQHVRTALPSWIENNLAVCKNFNAGYLSLQEVRNWNYFRFTNCSPRLHFQFFARKKAWSSADYHGRRKRSDFFLWLLEIDTKYTDLGAGTPSLSLLIVNMFYSLNDLITMLNYI